MSLTQRGIQFQRFFRGLASFRACFLWRECSAVARQGEVRTNKPRIGEGIIGVLRNGLLEIVNRLVHSTGRSAVPIESALQVQLISFWVLRGPLGHEILLGAGKLELQVFCDVVSDIRLQGVYVGKLALILLAPHLAVVLGVN